MTEYTVKLKIYDGWLPGAFVYGAFVCLSEQAHAKGGKRKGGKRKGGKRKDEDEENWNQEVFARRRGGTLVGNTMTQGVGIGQGGAGSATGLGRRQHRVGRRTTELGKQQGTKRTNSMTGRAKAGEACAARQLLYSMGLML